MWEITMTMHYVYLLLQTTKYLFNLPGAKNITLSMIYLLAIRVNRTIASFFLPTVISQRGDSGKIQKYMTTNTQGTDVTSCKYRHSLTKYAITASEK